MRQRVKRADTGPTPRSLYVMVVAGIVVPRRR
jgi:hypothetical protein